MDKNYEALKLQNQVCSPLYACSKEMIRQYKPSLQIYRMQKSAASGIFYLSENAENNALP